MTPLAPETVSSLREWIKQGRSSHRLFVSSTGAAWKYDKLGKAYSRAMALAGFDTYTFKHLRNIANTVRRDHRLPEEMGPTILGQTIKGTTKFYTGSADEKYLVPLVDAIRKDYFGGE